jgi:hypothetical protein
LIDCLASLVNRTLLFGLLHAVTAEKIWFERSSEDGHSLKAAVYLTDRVFPIARCASGCYPRLLRCATA